MLAKVQALKKPNKMLFDLSTRLPQVFISDTFTVKNSLGQMLAGGVCLGDFGALGVLLRRENFQLQTCCQYYLKISEWYIFTAVRIPGWALLSLGPLPSQWGHHKQDISWGIQSTGKQPAKRFLNRGAADWMKNLRKYLLSRYGSSVADHCYSYLCPWELNQFDSKLFFRKITLYSSQNEKKNSNYMLGCS